MMDALCYLDDNTQKKIFEWVNSHLHKNNFFLFSFIQNDSVQKKLKTIDNWEISNKFYKKIEINFDKKNLIKFLEFKTLIKKFNSNNLRIIGSHFDLGTYPRKNFSKIRIVRFV